MVKNSGSRSVRPQAAAAWSASSAQVVRFALDVSQSHFELNCGNTHDARLGCSLRSVNPSKL